MRVLVACEESQAVTKALRANGHEAFSCDLLPASGGHPEYHMQCNVLEVLDQAWDMMIGFPPCDHLAVSGARWFPEKRADGRQQQGVELFLALAHAPIPKVAIENPVGIMSTLWRKLDQIIQPWQFGDEATKTTCLWLRNMPLVKEHASLDGYQDSRAWRHPSHEERQAATGVVFQCTPQEPESDPLPHLPGDC